MREHKQKHDDAHFPLQGKGAKGKSRKNRLPLPSGIMRICHFCETTGPLGNDHWCEVESERATHWREFKEDNSNRIEGR